MTAAARLPANLAPRGLTADEAAAYCGLGVGTFRAEVTAGRLPGPVAFRGRIVWDRVALDRRWDVLSSLEAPPQSEGESLRERLRNEGRSEGRKARYRPS